MDISMMMSQLHPQIAQTGASAGAESAPAVTPEQADRFQALMSQGVPTPPVQSVPEHPDHNIVARAVSEQADYYRQVPNDMMYLMHHMSSLSMERMAAANMTVQMEISSLNADLQVKMAAVQSSKDAVQTLMKNQ
ncbi:serine kinase [Paraburkholderia caffeinilytica]|uniref:serine kinase n=1 Tax=Paraburkholderia caffeinilytica TaxID=1761016 RepID=UPI003DA1B442